MREVWFVRHGESAANAGEATDDPRTIPLTERGRAQARRVADAFRRPPTAIVVSPFARARETAEPTVARYGEARVETGPVEEFTYLSPESCRGTTASERAPRVARYWDECDPEAVDGPGAESFSTLIERARSFSTWLCETSDEFVAVFTHQQFVQAVRSVASRSDTATVESMRRFRSLDLLFLIRNCDVVRTVAYEGRLYFGPTLSTIKADDRRPDEGATS